MPVPVATYLLNEKRRSVFHIEKHHSVNILIIPNPNMVTPQYEVVRVRKDESIEEASYDVSVKQAAPEEAVMPKFDKEASKRDEPLLQGMSSPKQAPKQAATPAVKTEKAVESKGLFSGIVAWVKSLFAAEEEVKPVAPKKPQRNTPKSGERRQQRGRQGQRRNSRNENRGDNRNDARNDKRKQQDASDVKDNKQNKTAKPQKERVQKPKEEKVAERRQRRNNRKKVRVNNKEQAAVNTDNKNTAVTTSPAVEKPVQDKAVAVEANTNLENTTVEQTANKTKEEQRPRSRRSPRHMRAHGQRRRQNSDAVDAKAEITEDPVTTRYPEKQHVKSFDEANEAKPSEEIATSDAAIEKVAKQETVVATEVNNDVVNEVQQNLPFDEPATTEQVSTETEVAATVETPVVEASVVEAPAVEAPVTETPVVEALVVETPVVETKVAAIEETAQPVSESSTIVEQQAESVKVDEIITPPANVESTNKAPKAEVQAEEKPKKVRAKVKNIKRKVRAASGKAAGKASAPMTKPETIASNGTIPTDFVASEQRLAHSKSEKSAMIAHVTSRHSAGPTKPSLD